METLPETAPVRRNEDEWLWGWDPTPGIVSIWAEDDGRVTVWRRLPDSGELIREGDRFRPWLLLDRLDDLLHLGDALGRTEAADVRITYRELDGPGALRYLVSSDNYRTLNAAVLAGATQRLGRRVRPLQELRADPPLPLLPPGHTPRATRR